MFRLIQHSSSKTLMNKAHKKVYTEGTQVPFLTDMKQNICTQEKESTWQQSRRMKRQDSGGFRLSLGTDEHVKRIQAYFSSKRKQEVEFWIAEKMTYRRDGTIGNVVQVRTMAQLFEVWLEDQIHPTKAKTTYHSYQSIVKQIPEWFTKLKVDRVEAIHAQRLLADWSRTSLKASTINSLRAIWIRTLTYCTLYNRIRRRNLNSF